MKLPNFTFCGGREHKATTFFFVFLNSEQSSKIQLHKKIPAFDDLYEMEKARKRLKQREFTFK